MKLISEQHVQAIVQIIVNAKHDFKFSEINGVLIELQNLKTLETEKGKTDEKINTDSTAS